MQKTYKIDPAHSSAQFTVRHMMITNVRGSFSGVEGTVAYDPDNLAASSIDVIIDASTINTMDAQRDAHLKSADFLDQAQHPKIEFKGTNFQRKGDNGLSITGDLTIHGTTKPVVLTVDGPTEEGKDPWGNTRAGASATTKISRSDFGLAWNAALETGGILVGDELKIEIDVSLIKT